MTSNLVHHPDCAWWHDNSASDCQCGLTGPAIGTLRPWTQAAFDEWRRKINAEFQAIEQRGKL